MKIGLIALSTDLTIERDFHEYCDHDTYTTRIIFNNPITRESLSSLAGQVDDAKNRFPMKMDKYVFGCTSGTAVIGEANLPGLINPLTSARNWLNVHGRKELSLITAYTENVSNIVKEWFEQNGFKIVKHKFLNYSSDIEIGQLNRVDLLQTVLDFDPDCDTVFSSCTALPIVDMLEDLKTGTGVDYISSNQTMIWQLDNENHNLKDGEASGY